MNAVTKARLLLHIAKWRLTWNNWDTHYTAGFPDNPKFMPAAEAAKLINDGDLIATSGLGSNQWVSVMNCAIRDLFKKTGHPRNISLLAIGGLGSRGRVPGSLEELGLPGLCTRFFTGHTETFKSLLRLADQGQCEIQCLPQGMLALLLDAQMRGESEILSETGAGTFLDPRVGRGTCIAGDSGEQFIAVEDGKLRYHIPPINVAMFNMPAADRKGNIYAKNAAMLAESYEIAKAAKKNGGVVIANVGLIVDEGYGEVFLPAEDIDAVVPFPGTDQVGSVKHRTYWPLFTTHSDVPVNEGISRLKFINQVLGITPRRSKVDDALARLAASVFAEHAPKGSLVNIGVGLPEEVCRTLCKAGLYEDVTFFSESGVIGGLPAPGVFFGVGVCPERMISSAETFKMVCERLDVSVLGALQVDSQGNVNVSKRGEGAINYVGPGGFIDFTTAAHMVIFITSWMAHAKFRLENGEIRIEQPGKPKFIDHVDEVTFCGPSAAHPGKKVFYVTNVGVFQLTPQGVQLIRIVPGVDLQKDILDVAPMKVLLPESGEVPTVDRSIMTGEGFQLALG